MSPAFNDDYDPKSYSAYDPTHERQNDVVIAVMGSTGTGKSSFVKLLTSAKMGDSLQSETSEVKVIRFLDRPSGRNVTILDTPGFDDSSAGLTDTDILKMIIDYLLEEYDERQKLDGLIYLLRVSDPRLGVLSRRNLRIIQNLCGTAAYKNVVFLTTFWDQVVTDEGARREARLKSDYIQDLVAGGARFMRHDRTIESACQVLRHILPMPPKVRELEDDIELLKQGLTGRDTTIESLQKALSASHQEVKDLKAEVMQMETLQNALSGRDREVQDLKTKVTQIEALQNALSASHQEVQDLKTKVKETEALQNALSASHQEVRDLKMKITELEDRRSDLKVAANISDWSLPAIHREGMSGAYSQNPSDKHILFRISDDKKTTIRHSVEVVLTVTPPNHSAQGSGRAIVWQVLTLESTDRNPKSVTWHDDPAFGVVEFGESSIFIPAPMDQCVTLQSQGAGVVWNQKATQGKRRRVMARNGTRIPQTFCLGSTYGDDDDEFEEFVRYEEISPASTVVALPATMLQAYSVPLGQCKAGHYLGEDYINSFLFRDNYDAHLPQAVNLREIANKTSFTLARNLNGGRLYLSAD